ncbi:hypothetical protein BVRB_010560 [Beta vulgaris subsp. vulgaris]|uniref:Uncharacterized protein n=1 Tax=Beta vulgaris subsp. vulgaris TaxID=3555 RepID=A0A0J8B5T3_BETVV|nr:hypothetical protein BVRB_010560 [Beta vulgaris subsp. vulgaris]
MSDENLNWDDFSAEQGLSDLEEDGENKYEPSEGEGSDEDLDEKELEKDTEKGSWDFPSEKLCISCIYFSTCLRQPLGTLDCGYYVCRYMLEMVQLRRLFIPDKVLEH